MTCSDCAFWLARSERLLGLFKETQQWIFQMAIETSGWRERLDGLLTVEEIAAIQIDATGDMHNDDPKEGR